LNADSKVLERIRRLINLSQSANEHEAASAGRIVCKMLLEHKIKLKLGREIVVSSLQDNEDEDEESVPPPRQNPKPPKTPPPKPPKPAPPKPPKPAPPPKVKPAPPPRPVRNPAPQAVFEETIASYAGKCSWCGRRVFVGAPVMHSERVYYHLLCAERCKAATGGL
jgi:cell division septation protein DedD